MFCKTKRYEVNLQNQLPPFPYRQLLALKVNLQPQMKYSFEGLFYCRVENGCFATEDYFKECYSKWAADKLLSETSLNDECRPCSRVSKQFICEQRVMVLFSFHFCLSFRYVPNIFLQCSQWLILIKQAQYPQKDNENNMNPPPSQFPLEIQNRCLVSVMFL